MPTNSVVNTVNKSLFKWSNFRSAESEGSEAPGCSMRRRRDSNPDGADGANRDRNPSDSKRRKRSGTASETASANDNSHIVGHINEDGSIEPGE